jgi:hypothetical protein
VDISFDEKRTEDDYKGKRTIYKGFVSLFAKIAYGDRAATGVNWMS